MPSADLIAAIIVAAFLGIFLWHKRRNIQVQGFFPILYFVMYRTRRGIQRMERIANALPRFWKAFAALGTWLGFAGMAFIFYELVRGTLRLLIVPDAAPAVVPVLPVPVKGTLFVPFIYWILAVPIIAVIHEFSHGIIARLHRMRLKSTGFAFLGIILPVIPAAFVEPDEKAMARRPRREQFGVLAAGSFSNILTAVLVYLLFAAVLGPLGTAIFQPAGVSIVTIQENASASLGGLLPGDVVTSIGGQPTQTMKDFAAVLASFTPGARVQVQTNRTTQELVLGNNPADAAKPYLGITAREHQSIRPDFVLGRAGAAAYAWIAGLLYFVFLLSAGIGLFNLLPLGPLDGGKMFRLAMEKLLGSRGTKVARAVSIVILLLLAVNLIALFF